MKSKYLSFPQDFKISYIIICSFKTERILLSYTYSFGCPIRKKIARG